ncbi:MFS transporter [Amycolatopsis jejuensis]|uniref:MFS transporter n=1 Tax=Amycolatopsis jejuensis TaxID=330084 RepID=UPI000B333C91|nr:MFS transporter [Amycolatopsis jejuensis]
MITAVTTGSRWAVAVAVAGQMLVLLDNTIVNIAVESLADPVRGLGASATELTWAVSSYSLVFTAVALVGGALTDRIGPRAALVSGLLVLAGSATVAAFSATATELVVARCFMGAGGALVTPATLAVVTRCSTPAGRSRAIAVWASSGGIAVALGPVLGGLLLARFWWGSIFLVNLPVAVACLIGVVLVVPGRGGHGQRPLDPLGLVMSGVGLAALVYGIVEAGDGRFGFDVLAALAIGVLLLIAFVVQQRFSAKPSLDLKLFRRAAFGGGSAVLLLAFLCLAGQLYYCAFYLQGVRGLSTLAAGGVMVAAAAGIIPGNQMSPALVRRFGARLTVAAALTATGATYAAYLLLDQSTALVWFILLLFVQGLGIGVLLPALTEQMMTALPGSMVGAGAAVNSVTRPLGSTLGVAVLGSILAAGYRQGVAVPGLPPDQQDRAAQSIAGAKALGRPEVAALADHAYLHAMSVTAGWTVLLTAAGVLITVFVFPRPGSQ